jgi:Uma2 family endonuclease
VGVENMFVQEKTKFAFVYHLVEGEYTVELFTGKDVLRSPSFPNLSLTAEQIFQVGQ